ncbi:MAG: WecB/TagA/CpsF family glycosyltransferase [Firmicutes bacterium]|nr:WecB/TagA/CpsF family glycosyltransferase [Bacillota bacterium]
MTRKSLLGLEIDAVTLTEAVARVAAFVSQNGTHQVVTLNPEYLYRARTEEDLQEIVRGASLVTADGVGIVWAARVLGVDVPERVTGIDLMLAICEQAAVRGWRVFLLGGRPGIAEKAAAELIRDFPGLTVAGVYHGYFKAEEELSVVAKIKRAKPHVLFVGLGAPAQERWIYQNRVKLGVPVAMGVGGSFDVLSGKVKRAPVWMRRLGLEWLARLIREPWRWRRMLVLPLFVFYVLKQRVCFLLR